MEIYSHYELPPWPAGRIVSVGVFDGVHLGHQRLISLLLDRARESGCRPTLLTFRQHPQQLLGLQPPPLLSTLEEKLALLARMSLPELLLLDFDAEMAGLEAIDFLDRVLLNGVGMVELLVGPDFALGRKRGGDLCQLTALAESRGFRLRSIAPLLFDGQVVSSTRIRNLLAAGDVGAAEKLLGGYYRLRGRVGRGQARGRRIGYRTANIETEPLKLLPGDGVYAAWAEFDGCRHEAVANIGQRPTFGQGLRLLEVHCLDCRGDFYGAVMDIHFVSRLRAERRFASPEALAAQITDDIKQAREKLHGK